MPLKSWLQRFVIQSATAIDADESHGELSLPETERTTRGAATHPEHVASPAKRRAGSCLLAFTLLALMAGTAGALLVPALLPTRPSGNAATPPPSEQPAPYYLGYPGWLDGKLRVGEQAPDFALPEITSGQTVRLSEFRGRTQVVLIFGSTSSTLLRKQAGPLEGLYQTYGGRAKFLFVHLREAGAVPSAGPPGDPRERVRQALASFPLTMLCVLDGARAETQEMYQAWPQRLVIVGIDGRIAVDAGRGLSDGWDLTEVEDWLKEQKP
jgi:hypothetical protein